MSGFAKYLIDRTGEGCRFVFGREKGHFMVRVSKKGWSTEYIMANLPWIREELQESVLVDTINRLIVDLQVDDLTDCENIYEDALKKQTPMRAVEEWEPDGSREICCPACKQVWEGGKFCSECGQRISMGVES